MPTWKLYALSSSAVAWLSGVVAATVLVVMLDSPAGLTVLTAIVAGASLYFSIDSLAGMIDAYLAVREFNAMHDRGDEPSSGAKLPAVAGCDRGTAQSGDIAAILYPCVMWHCPECGEKNFTEPLDIPREEAARLTGIDTVSVNVPHALYLSEVSCVHCMRSFPSEFGHP